MALVAAPADGRSEPAEVTPAGFSVRTRVHEYGGRCYAVHGSTVVFSNWADQRLWVIRGGAGPVAAYARAAAPGGVRFADPGRQPRRALGGLRPRDPPPPAPWSTTWSPWPVTPGAGAAPAAGRRATTSSPPPGSRPTAPGCAG